MPDNLKCNVRLLAVKYAWHTLGETIARTSTRNIQTLNKYNLLSINRNEEEYVDSTEGVTHLRKTNEYRKVARPEENVIRSAKAKTLPELVKFKRNTKSKKLIYERETLTADIYREYNRVAFDSMLPEDLRISWSRRLTSTAGITKMSCLVTGKVKVSVSL